MASITLPRDRSALVEIKKLYYNHQYKQCISACQSFLSAPNLKSHSLMRATVLFFQGLSHDTQARNMSYRSPLLLRALDQAELSFREATAILPSLSPPAEELRTQTISKEDESPRQSRSHFGRRSLGSQGSSPSLAFSGTTISEASQDEDALNRTFGVSNEEKEAPSPSELTFASDNLDELKSASHPQRYNQLLTTLNVLINKHLASIESYRQLVKAAHDREQRFGTLLSSKEMTVEEKFARVARGRASGWKRARFNAQRYQELCDRALGEL